MSLHVKFIPDNICAPQGFKASGIYAGLRKSQKSDLALIVSEIPATAAGVFTQNKMKAAPVTLTQRHVKKGNLQAIIINSGNANACTGENGLLHAKQTADALAAKLSISPKLIGVASTGVIGVPLPIDKLTAGILPLTAALTSKGGLKAAAAILTTDTFMKEAAIQIALSDGTTVTLGGIAKGSGMIHPNMATMLAFITTDAVIAREVLQTIFRKVIDTSFNMISVDGDSSTNDMALIMANGKARNKEIDCISSADGKIFSKALQTLCIHLAKQIAKDGEGARKLITVHVSGAKTILQAGQAAKAVASSSLVKTAIFGNDANWGRVACAIGYSGALISPAKLKISLGNLNLLNNGRPQFFSKTEAMDLLQQSEVTFHINLGVGKAQATAWGCDLSYDYVRINAAYRS